MRGCRTAPAIVGPCAARPEEDRGRGTGTASRPRRRHRGLHPAAVRRRPRPGRLPAARRRRGHRAPGPRSGPGHDLRRRHAGQGAARGRQLRVRRLPHRRRRAPRAGAGDRRGHHHPRGARVLRAAASRRARPACHRRGAGAGAVLRPDGEEGRGRPRSRRPPDLRQPRLPRRHPRRARVHQRRVRGGDQDELRALPAVLDLLRRGARQAGAQREGAGLQRQGRGPAVPRPRQHPPRRRRCAPTTPSSTSPRHRSGRWGSSPRRRPTTCPGARTSPGAPAGCRRSGGRCTSSAATS